MAARRAAAWSSSAFPTPWCGSRSTACAPPSSTPARRSRSGGSPSGCRRRRCPSRGVASTSRSPPRSWPRPGAVPRRPVDRLVLLGELGLDGSVRGIRGRAAGGPGRGPRRPPRRWSCPRPTPTRRPWSSSIEVLAACARWPRSSPTSPAGRRLHRHVRGPLPAAPPAARPRRRRRAGGGTAGGRGRRRRRAPPVPDRSAGRRQDHARRAAARSAAAAGRAGRARGHAPSTRSPARCRPTRRWSPGRRSRRRTTRRRWPRWSAAGRGRSGPGRCAGPTAGCCSWTRRRSSRGRCSTPCASRWSAAPVTIHRAAGSATFPCRAQLVLAANPCPCASAAGDTACTCSPLERRRYQSRLSGPLLDRIDLRVDLPPVTRAAWLDGVGAAGADGGRGAPGACRPRRRRPPGWPAPGCRSNSQVPGRLLRERWAVPRASLQLAERALERGALSVRGLRPRAPGRLDARRPRGPRGPGRRRGRRGARHAAAAGGGMTLDEDLEDAAGDVRARGAPGGAAGARLAEPGRRAGHDRLLAVRRRTVGPVDGGPPAAVGQRARPASGRLVGRARAAGREPRPTCARAERVRRAAGHARGRRVAGRCRCTR